MLSRRGFLVFLCVLGVMLWIEHAHRTYIGLPTPAQIAIARAHAAGCPDTDTAPYTATCLLFIAADGSAAPVRAQADETAADPAADLVPN
jgi:hypothetical protein